MQIAVAKRNDVCSIDLIGVRLVAPIAQDENEAFHARGQASIQNKETYETNATMVVGVSKMHGADM